jgi:hypothetical protein
MGLSFQYADASILFCIPEQGCDLNYLVERYTCFERIAVPTYEIMAGCLRRAVGAGVLMFPAGGLYRLTPEWYARVHRSDGKFSASDYAMIEFADELQSQEWAEVGVAEFELSMLAYQSAATHTQQYLDRLFTP